MKTSMFHGTIVTSNRIIYTPSSFAKKNLFYLQEAGQLQAKKPHTSQRQDLSSFLFFIVLSGSGTLTYDNKIFSLAEGDCIFLDCQKPYSHHTSDALWSLKWVHFFGPNAQNIYKKYVDCGGEPCFRSAHFKEYEYILDNLFQIAAIDDTMKELKICEKLTSLWVLLLGEFLQSESTPQAFAAKRNLDEVKKYIDEHYFEKISLELLESIFYINKFYLSRLFKEQFGTSIGRYLLNARITQAKHLLRFTPHTIDEVGQKCGMNDANYFSRMFKKVEGITPRDYRKLWCNSNRY